MAIPQSKEPKPPSCVERFEHAIGSLAARQHGVVTLRQLVAGGLSRHRVHRRIASGRLRVVHRGVYLVGPVDGPRSREMAAVLACGGSAALSHRTAAHVRGLLSDRERRAVDVSVERGNPRRPGIRVHRVRALPADEVTRLDGIPTTTVSRTILDLAGVVSVRELEQAFAKAERRKLAMRPQILRLLARYPARPGAPALRALLEAGAPPAFTRSVAEERFLDLITTAGLPRPAVNATIAGGEVDFAWLAQRLVVEVDGYAFHSSRRAFATDRRRTSLLAEEGYRLMRVTWHEIAEREALLVRLTRALYGSGS